MKIRSAAAIAVICAAFTGIGHAASSPAADRPLTIFTSAAFKAGKAAPIQADRMKDILFRLVRQDEYLDEALAAIESSNGKLSIHNLSALGLSFKLIKNDLNAISAMNKREFPGIRPEPGVAVYTRTILSYSRSVSRKVVKINALMAKTAFKSKKLAMRDAVSSRKSGGPRNGKKLTRILEEQKAIEMLMSDIQTLRASSRKLTATSKWLYIVSK